MAQEYMQEVQPLLTVVEKTTSYSPDHYQLRTDKKHVWVQKIAIWVLRKLGCYAINTHINYVRHTIDTRDFAQRVMIANAELANTYHYRGSRLLVGYEEFKELGGYPINHPLSFTGQYMWQERTYTDKPPYYDTHRTACGLSVTIIPWLRGFLILPKDFQS